MRTGRMRRAATWSIASALSAAVASACGQIPGVHRRPVPLSASPANALVSASPNGENTGPTAPLVGYTVITTTRETTRPGRPRNGNGDGKGNRNRGKPVVVPGPFLLCPVQGRGFFGNDFGAPRYAGGYHPHAGNDIFAALGTPIVAPFDGTAVATPNGLGGNSVTVYGRDGYVYNAHLATYGSLGPVKAGTVIGYVGNSGDALGGPPHDHFEWHPGGGAAVNPYPFLRAVCT